MANAMLVEIVDADASDMDVDEFDRWSTTLRADINDRPFVRRRVAEWLLLKQLASDGEGHTAELLASTDWLQRKAAEETRDRAVLAVLAESANTRRIRSVAATRLRSENWV